MAFEDWKKCPVDGTRYFIRTAAYPHGRPPGTRYCSTGCEARATHGTGKPAPFYVPEVDGTLGSGEERANGGPQLNAFGELARGGMTDLFKGQLS